MSNASYLNIKVPLQAVGWKTKLIPDLEELVCQTSYLTEHTYQLAAWIIAGEMKWQPEFDPGIELSGTSSFLYHVFMRLANISAEDIDKAKEQFIGPDPPEPKVKHRHAIRDLIECHFHGYLALTSMEPRKYSSMSYTAHDAQVQIETACLNNIKNNFGRFLKNTIRHLANPTARKVALAAELGKLTRDQPSRDQPSGDVPSTSPKPGDDTVVFPAWVQLKIWAALAKTS